MINFSKYLELYEATRTKKPPKQKEFNLNDAKGKLYEILAGSHLQHGTNEAGAPNKLLTHYRDEEGKTPQDVHDYIKKELDARDPNLYNQINTHAIGGANHIRSHLASAGHNQINQTAWTSQPGDHKRFTSVEDPNSDADVMVKTEKGPLGVSLKYGKSKDMNLRNNGLEELENIGGLNRGDLSNLRANHQKFTAGLGIKDHEHYKQLKNSSNPEDKNLADQADKSALSAQKEMARKMSEGLTKRSSSDDGQNFLRNYVKSRIAPQTQFQHFRLHTRPDEKGGATHHMSDMSDDASKLENFEHFRVAPHSGGISFRIEGRRKGADSYEPILDQAIKKGSGPMKGFASTTKAPFLTKKDKTASPVASSPTSKPVKSRKAAVPVQQPVAPIVQQPQKVQPILKMPQQPQDSEDLGRWADDGGPSGEHGGVAFNSPADIQHAKNMRITGAQ